ncbi:MAG: sigma-70 family RNA polymerase sigma factor [bacterium]
MGVDQQLDGKEIRALLETHHGACFGWALNCCGRDQHRAEDVLQTAYVSIMDGSARYDGRAAFKTWLFAVIRRTAANQLRRSLR